MLFRSEVGAPDGRAGAEEELQPALDREVELNRDDLLLELQHRALVRREEVDGQLPPVVIEHAYAPDQGGEDRVHRRLVVEAAEQREEHGQEAVVPAWIEPGEERRSARPVDGRTDEPLDEGGERADRLGDLPLFRADRRPKDAE